MTQSCKSPSSRNTKAARPRKRLTRRFVPVIELLEDRTLLDSAGPRVLSLTPLEMRNAVFDHVDVRFNEAIDANTFTDADIAIVGPNGAVAPSNVAPVSADTVRVSFASLTVRGNYQVTIGPDISDLAGNPMDQNQNSINGEATADQFSGTLVYIVADAIF